MLSQYDRVQKMLKTFMKDSKKYLVIKLALPKLALPKLALPKLAKN